MLPGYHGSGAPRRLVFAPMGQIPVHAPVRQIDDRRNHDGNDKLVGVIE